MADQDILMNSVNDTLGSLRNLMEAQGMSIESFSGDPKKFNNWVKDIEKYSILAHLNPEKMKTLAYKTSSDAVSDYIKRRLLAPAHANETWNDLKKALALRFSEITDPQLAFTLLRKERQMFNEGVQVFAERLIFLAEQAFRDANPDVARSVDNQLIGIFTDGLYDTALKFKLLRADPTSLQDAIDIALKEENLRRRFTLRTSSEPPANQPLLNNFPINHNTPPSYTRHETPMEVNHMRPCRQCTKQNIRTHEHKNIVHDINEIQSNTQNSTQTYYQPPRSQITCHFCGKPGHIQRNCFLRNRRNNNRFYYDNFTPRTPTHQVRFNGPVRPRPNSPLINRIPNRQSTNKNENLN